MVWYVFSVALSTQVVMVHYRNISVTDVLNTQEQTVGLARTDDDTNVRVENVGNADVPIMYHTGLGR